MPKPCTCESNDMKGLNNVCLCTVRRERQSDFGRFLPTLLQMKRGSGSREMYSIYVSYDFSSFVVRLLVCLFSAALNL